MQVYRITQSIYARDLSGNGARLYGGRWNTEGKYALYTAENRSLALLENLLHVPFKFLQTTSYSLVEFNVPDKVSILQLDVRDLPVHWNAWIPCPASRRIGDAFLEDIKYLMLRVPSTVIPEEFNYVLNPLHPDMRRVKITSQRKLSFNDCLLQTFQN